MPLFRCRHLSPLPALPCYAIRRRSLLLIIAASDTYAVTPCAMVASYFAIDYASHYAAGYAIYYITPLSYSAVCINRYHCEHYGWPYEMLPLAAAPAASTTPAAADIIFIYC